MARLLGTLALLAIFASSAVADDDKRGEKDNDKREDRSGPRRPRGGPEFEKTREAFKQMSPEERQKWVENFRRWQELPPDQKKSLSDRQEFFRKRMREDIDNAIKDSGLQFNEEQKKQFTQRYAEERRKLEDELRKQMEEIRRPKVKELIEKLKQEFATQVAATPVIPNEPTPPVIPNEPPKDK